MKKSFGVLIIALILICISCSALKIDYKVDNSCPAPCWKGLNIGMGYDEVLKTVLQMEEYEVEEKRGLQDSSSILLKNRDGELNVLSFSSAKVLRAINLGFQLEKMKLPLRKVISEYGEPNNIVTWFAGMPMNTLDAVICYPEIGLTIHLKPITKRGSSKIYLYSIRQDTNVLSVTYDNLDPTTSGVGVNYCKEPLDIAQRYDWVGYGEYLTCEAETNSFCEP